MMQNHNRVLLLSFSIFLLANCGGGNSEPKNTVPSSPSQVTINSGNEAISIGWAQPENDGGAPITGYEINITPPIANSNIVINGTHALIANLENDTEYQISVAAINKVGTGSPSASLAATPKAPDSANYTELTISNDPGSPNGIYDPSLLRDSNDNLWLSYSSVNYYLNDSENVVQDVGIRIAKSSDNGASFDWVTTIVEPSDTTVTDTDTELRACGATSCSGRWVYETSWLVEDASDPDPNRRFKLFAHKYFLYPPGDIGNATLYHLGAIVMWTASAPDSAWSDETVLIGWPSTAPELSPQIDVTTLSSELENCIVVGEGGASVRGETMDMVFACPYFDIAKQSDLQKIVLLRSTDHANSFQYVSTLLTANDVVAEVEYFSAPALITTADQAPILLVTPVDNGIYAGSVVYPIADLEQGTLFTSANKPLAINFIPVQGLGHFGGASAFARSTESLGVVQSDAILGATLADTQFRILATKVMASP